MFDKKFYWRKLQQGIKRLKVGMKKNKIELWKINLKTIRGQIRSYNRNLLMDIRVGNMRQKNIKNKVV